MQKEIVAERYMSAKIPVKMFTTLILLVFALAAQEATSREKPAAKQEKDSTATSNDPPEFSWFWVRGEGKIRQELEDAKTGKKIPKDKPVDEYKTVVVIASPPNKYVVTYAFAVKQVTFPEVILDSGSPLASCTSKEDSTHSTVENAATALNLFLSGNGPYTMQGDVGCVVGRLKEDMSIKPVTSVHASAMSRQVQGYRLK